ncbi:MAG: hypothetical protein OEY96_09250 [Gammaproteobacteria bacterium]|nr:hypothetical protein [Gammaproteobacteria bacterium]
MILRRFIKHVTDRNWFAVGIDLLVVIIGIFFGLQLTNWNDEQKEVNRSVYIQDRLHKELMEDANGLEKRLIYWNKVAEYGEFAISYLETNQQGERSNWEVLLAIYQASNTWRFSVNRITYDELVNNGELNLIKSASLREDLAEYYNVFERRRSGLVYDFVPQYRLNIRGALHYQLQRNIHKNCHTEEMYVQALIDCSAQISEKEAAVHLKAIADRPEILETLRYWMSSLRIGIYQAYKDRDMALNLATKVRETKQ